MKQPKTYTSSHPMLAAKLTDHPKSGDPARGPWKPWEKPKR